MKRLLKPIALNERSYNVNLLHKILETFGLTVAKKEIAEGKAGKDTLKKVRTLQAQLNVPVDESVLVGEATSLAILEALEEKGLIETERMFTVSGKVQLHTGEVKKRQQLVAFDLDGSEQSHLAFPQRQHDHSSWTQGGNTEIWKRSSIAYLHSLFR